MKTFTVHEKPEPKADRLDRAEDLLFVRDGFSWLTAIFPPAGLLSARLWFATAVYLAVVTLLSWVSSTGLLAPAWVGLLIIALHIYLGFEVSTLRRQSLEYKGWNEVGTVSGRTRDECERRFLESWLPAQPLLRRSNDGDQIPPASGAARFATWPQSFKA